MNRDPDHTEGEQERLLLRRGARALGVELSEGQEEALLRYLDLLYVWNRSAGLTRIPREKAVRLHLLDSLAAQAALAEADRSPCLDLGTGGGLPGLVLAVANPGRDFVLAESNRRRCSFLLEAVRVLGIANVRVAQGDVADLPQSSPYPLVISRAFRPPAEFLAIASGLTAKGGRVVLLMADPSETDLSALEAGSGLVLKDCRRLVLPGGDEPRAIVVFAKP